MARPSLLLLTAAASALAVVANAATLAAPDPDAAAKTRLGNSIEQDINARDSAAAKRKRGLDLREQAAKAAEARIQADIEARQKEAAAAGPAGAPGSEPGLPAEAQYDELARIYQAMKPAKAALVFEQLDMEVQMKVAQRMRANSTASILAAMTPRGAAALSMALARKSAARPRPLASASPMPPAARPPAKPPATMAGR